MNRRNARTGLGVALVSVMACLAGTSRPARADEVLTPHNVAGIRSVSSVAMAPDGRTIAYVLSIPRRPMADEDGGPWEELHVVGADGVSRPFITGEVNVAGVRFTPDGKSLSFLARRGKDTARSLYVMPLDGGEPRRVLAHETDIGSYAWSRDGARVAFTARDAVPKERRDWNAGASTRRSPRRACRSCACGSPPWQGRSPQAA